MQYGAMFLHTFSLMKHSPLCTINVRMDGILGGSIIIRWI